MRAFHAPAQPTPPDQAQGLRRLFAGRPAQRLLPLVANPHVAFGGLVLDQMAALLAAAGHSVLVVDAAAHSQAPAAIARVDLAAAIQTLGPRQRYLAARGLPLAFVDTRGQAGGFIDAIQRAAPEAAVVLLHAEGAHLARMLQHHAVRPLLLAADHPESVKHAYAGAKLLAQRCGLATFDLLLAQGGPAQRARAIASSVGRCLESFMGAWLQGWAQVDPAGAPPNTHTTDLAQLLAAQLSLDDTPVAERPFPPFAHPGALRTAATPQTTMRDQT